MLWSYDVQCDVLMSDADTPSPQGSPFWRFSLQFYRQPAVAQACIALQEDAGVDVNLLLLLLWFAGKRRRLAAPEIEALDRRVRDWRDSTIKPLRSIRRDLKTPPDLVAAPLAEAFRTRIKAVELEAERLQQEAMYALALASPFGLEASSALEAARASIEAYEDVRELAFASDAVDALLTAFATLQPKPEEE
jgi:uncharacterized protein (TIGR02444 family)